MDNNITKVPCAECSKLITITANLIGQPNFCDKFCKSKNQIKQKRGTKTTVVNRPSNKTRSCRSCGRR